MPDIAWRVRESEGGVVFSLHVQPRAKRCEAAGIHGTALKLKVAAPAAEGAANRAVIGFLADALQIPRSAVHIVSGEKSREKVIRVDGVGLSRLLRLLE